MENMRFKKGDRVRIKSLDWYNENKNILGNVECGDALMTFEKARFCGKIVTISNISDVTDTYGIEEDNGLWRWTDEMIERLVEEETKPKNMGEVSDGYHTFNELYQYRMLYNAALFNEFAKQGLYDVHKSRKHYDGGYPFGDSNWFVVMAELPTGQISNHYEMKDWDKFQIPEKEVANKWDGHSPKDVAERLTNFTTPKKKYPKTYGECLSVLEIYNGLQDVEIYNAKPSECELFETFIRLKRCRDTYWKLYGEENGLEKPWEPDWNNDEIVKYCIIVDSGIISKQNFRNYKFILAFPTEEIRDVFFENFKEEIEQCKELL